LEARFKRLADAWVAETAVLSSPTQTMAHPAFQEIVSMGEAVIPIVLRRMQEGKGDWFLVLSRITGETPLPPRRGRKD
jgi:hypothetical protein